MHTHIRISKAKLTKFIFRIGRGDIPANTEYEDNSKVTGDEGVGSFKETVRARIKEEHKRLIEIIEKESKKLKH